MGYADLQRDQSLQEPPLTDVRHFTGICVVATVPRILLLLHFPLNKTIEPEKYPLIDRQPKDRNGSTGEQER